MGFGSRRPMEGPLENHGVLREVQSVAKDGMGWEQEQKQSELRFLHQLFCEWIERERTGAREEQGVKGECLSSCSR